MAQAQSKEGKVVQVIGPVIDVEFEGELPEILNAVRVVATTDAGVKIDLTAEVAQHLGEKRGVLRREPCFQSPKITEEHPEGHKATGEDDADHEQAAPQKMRAFPYRL